MTTGRRRAGSPREDELLSRLYQQVTEQQAARFAAGYDLAAGLDRYRNWLGEHTAGEQARPQPIQLGEHTAREQARPQAIPVRLPAAQRAAPAGSGAGLAAAVIGGPAVLGRTVQGSTDTGTLAAGAAQDAAQAVTALYSTHYRSLVRLAALLVRDAATAEEIVQDSFTALHTAWPRVRDTEKALFYLRQSVVNRSRSVLRHRVIVDKDAPKPAPDLSTAEQAALNLLEHRQVVMAMRSLPPRQREALVLRYYGDLSEAQVASAMGISRGAVRSHLARAFASLRATLAME
jgi:RNA polymerase sigma-70 factor (sigma-E family)